MQPVEQATTRTGFAAFAPGMASAPNEAAQSAPTRASDAFDSLYIRRPRAWLAAILVAYLLSAGLYAWNTPPWQTPDEPAHYNYIAHIAEQGSLPVLRIGDYDQSLLDRLTATRFNPPDGLERVRYESHQPPLYYLLATPVYWVSGGNLLALRLLSILIGLASLSLLYFCLELIFTNKTLITVGATAFAALLPMHVALLSAVNNDGLAELLVMASLLVVLSWMRLRFLGGVADNVAGQGTPASGMLGRKRLVLLGVLLGLGMLTKVYAYVLTPIMLATVIMVVWLQPRIGEDGRGQHSAPTWRRFGAGVRMSLWTLAPAAALGGLWWVRNLLVYGGWDVLGLSQHARVVAEQPRSMEWIAIHGWAVYGERALTFTFRSFWGVFGWMGVFMDARVYTASLLFTGVLFLGLLWAMVRLISGRPDADMDLLQLWVLGLFAAMIAAVLAAFAWYNADFMQHQGRYFFWGLLPIGAIVALGWREVMQPLQGVITAGLALVVAVGVAAAGMVTDGDYKWTVMTVGCIALLLLLQPLLLAGTNQGTLRRMPRFLQGWLSQPRVEKGMRWARAGVWALPFVLMFALNVVIPFVLIEPQLSP